MEEGGVSYCTGTRVLLTVEWCVRAHIRAFDCRYIGMWADAFPTNDGGDAYVTMEQVRFFWFW